jgi:hypothetical protein
MYIQTCLYKIVNLGMAEKGALTLRPAKEVLATLTEGLLVVSHPRPCRQAFG